MIIGITGLIGSGKGAVSEILITKGFEKLGHSEIISQELIKRGLELNRNNQVDIGNELRRIEGAGYWAKKLISTLDIGKNYVVEGFRNIAEVEEFKKLPNFFLVGISAGFRRRFEWILKRKREGDPQGIDEFKYVEKRDFLDIKQDYGQQNAICFSMADYYISNEGTLEDLKKEVEKMLVKMGIYDGDNY